MADGFVEANGLRLHFLDWTSSKKQNSGSFVLVHGVGSSAHIWDLAAPLVAEQSGMRVVAIDQRGHGESEQPDSGYDFQAVVADLQAFIEVLGLTAPRVLVGHSWGASVVVHFAVEHPKQVDGLILVDGGTSSPGERWTWPETESRLTPPNIDGLLWADLRQRMARNNGAYSDSRAEAVGRFLFNVDAEGKVARRFRIPNHMQVVRALWEQRPAELLARVRCPVLILPASQSNESPEWLANKATSVQRAFDVLTESRQHARVRWFDDTVHDVPLQRPTELAAELAGFAAEIESASARA